MTSIAPAPQMPEAQRPAPVARAKSNKPFTAEDHELIRTEAALDEWIAESTKAGVVSFDLEAHGAERGLVGIAFALLEGPWGNVNSSRRRAAYLPIGHRGPGEAQGALDLGGAGKTSGDTLLPDQLALKTVVEKLKPLLEDPGVLKVGHDIKDDLDVLEQHGIRISPVDDTMLLSFVLDGGKHGHGLDDLAERYLDQ